MSSSRATRRPSATTSPGPTATSFMVNASGTVLGRISYDGFGKIVSDTTGGSGDRHKYTGREWDSALALQYNRARYYDPTIGKWTSTDPIGFSAGDTNLYRYVANGPTNATDATGLWSWNAFIGGNIIGGPPIGIFAGGLNLWSPAGAAGGQTTGGNVGAFFG